MSSEAIGAIADRYSAALFALAEEKSAFEAVESDLKALKALLAESADLRRLVSSPVISRKDQGKAVIAIAQKAGWSDLTRNLLGLLAQNRRLFTISGVIDAFLARLAAQRGEVTAQVTTAKALTAAQKKSLAASLKKAVGKDVMLDVTVDASLLGGLVAKVGSRMVDSSLKTQLQQLTLALKGVR